MEDNSSNLQMENDLKMLKGLDQRKAFADTAELTDMVYFVHPTIHSCSGGHFR